MFEPTKPKIDYVEEPVMFPPTYTGSYSLSIQVDELFLSKNETVIVTIKDVVNFFYQFDTLTFKDSSSEVSFKKEVLKNEK
jgi:hypothetical protein